MQISFSPALGLFLQGSSLVFGVQRVWPVTPPEPVSGQGVPVVLQAQRSPMRPNFCCVGVVLAVVIHGLGRGRAFSPLPQGDA